MTVKYCESNEISEEKRKVLNDYVSSLKNANRLEETITNNKRILEQYLGKCTVPLESLTSMEAFKLFTELTADKNDRTKKHYISCLSSFFRFCLQEGFIKKGITMNRWMSKTPPLRIYLTEKEYARVRLGVKELSERDRAIILFLFSTGCRSQEICNLSIKDLNFENRTAKINGMKSVDRYILFSKECAFVLKEYLQTRSASPEDPLFASRSGQRLRPATIIQITRKLGEKVKLFCALTPSVCRHTFAMTLLKRGVTLYNTVYLLGYANFNPIYKYIKILNEKKN